MKMIDSTAMSRFTALREAARKRPLVRPPACGSAAPRKRETASVALEFPTPLVAPQLHPSRQALSFLFSCLRHRADG